MEVKTIKYTFQISVKFNQKVVAQTPLLWISNSLGFINNS